MERQERPAAPEPTGAGARPGSGFLLLARLWIVAGALAWGTSLAYALSGYASLGPEMAGLSAPRAPLRGGAVAAGAAVAAALVWLGALRFGRQLEWRKPGQGKSARGTALASVLALSAFAAFSLMIVPESTSLWWADLKVLSVFGLMIRLKPIVFLSAGVLTTLVYAAFLFMNRERASDFLIETEGELKKVSWPARKDFLGSAVVVLVVVVVVSLFLTAVDNGLSWLMQKTKIGF